MNRKKLIKRLQEEEGLSLKLYKCPAGKWTIGYGRNLEAKGISRAEACMMLANDLTDAIHQCEKNILYFDALPANVQEVLVDMCFNMGIGNLLLFKKMLTAISKGYYLTASDELMDSKYARSKWTRRRAERNCEILRGNSETKT